MYRPTSSFEKASVDVLVDLPRGVFVADVACATRSAGLAFLTGAAGGWGRHELARWLLNEYEPATVSLPSARQGGASSGVGAINDVEICVLVEAARSRVASMLMAAAKAWSAPSFGRDMTAAGLVTTVRDAQGNRGYAPAAGRGLRLVDRVASLFVADYLARPQDYGHVRVCRSCEGVSIGAQRTHAPWCAEESNLVERRSRAAIRPLAARHTILGMGSVSTLHDTHYFTRPSGITPRGHHIDFTGLRVPSRTR